MSKHRRSKLLKVRVKYEPNRFSQECLQQVYRQFSPTAAVSFATGSEPEQATTEVETDTDVVKTPGSSQ